MPTVTRYLLQSTILLITALATINAQVSTDPTKHEIEVRGVYSVPSGETSFSSSGSTGSVISFDRDFDFRNELGFELRYTYRAPSGKHKVMAAYGQTTWNRSSAFSRTITFLGETYQANLAITSDLRLSNFRGMYSYRWGNEKIRIGPMVDMGVVSTRLNLTGTTNNGVRSGSGSISKFAATVGYDLDYDPSPRINLFNNLGAIAFQGDHLFHVEGGLRVFATRNLGFSGGYKAERYKLEDGPNFLTIRAHGPFFGGVFRF